MSNITPLSKHKTPSSEAAPRYGVTIINGDQWAARFTSQGMSLTLGFGLMEDLRNQFAEQGQANPDAVSSHDTRAALINMLDLSQSDIARLDANAAALGTDFASVVRAEISIEA